MPSLWLPAIPKRKQQRPSINPGFTDEDLRYLESTLAIIESISLDTIGLDNERVDIEREGKPLARVSHGQPDEGAKTAWVREHLDPLVLWISMHPNTVAMFLVFLASILVRSGGSHLYALLAFVCLLAGLRIMAATEDGFDVPSRFTSNTTPRPAMIPTTLPPTGSIQAEQQQQQ